LSGLHSQKNDVEFAFLDNSSSKAVAASAKNHYKIKTGLCFMEIGFGRVLLMKWGLTFRLTKDKIVSKKVN